MNLLSIFPPSVTRAVGRASLYAQKYAPEILMGAGIVSGVAATVFACKATLKVDKVKCDTQATFIKIGSVRYQAEHGQLPEGESYTEEDARKDMAVAYLQGAWALARLYAPAIGLGVLSVGLLTQSHRIMNKRNASLLAAYNALSLTFDQYKEKVSNDFGVDPIPVINEVIGEEVETTVSGEQPVENKKKPVVRPKALSQYTQIWSRETAKRQWQNSRLYNEFFLKSQEKYFNDRLKSQGHLFLNEVLDGLGLDHTEEGCFVGWLYGYNPDGVNRDEYVRIGWNHPRNAVEPLKDPNPPYILDFNVDGPIYDKLR